MFLSAHYSGEDMVLKFQANEAWKKVFGPVFIYLNSVGQDTSTGRRTTDQCHSLLWNDAKIQVLVVTLSICLLVCMLFSILATEARNCNVDINTVDFGLPSSFL